MSASRRPKTASSLSSSVSRRSQGGVRGSMPHQLYMRLTCLEMERHRRGIEREAALTRVRICDERSRDIDQEMAEIKDELRRRRMLGDPAVETVAPVPTPVPGSRRSSPATAARAARTTDGATNDGGDAPMPFKY